jgi:hypothetical protein
MNDNDTGMEQQSSNAPVIIFIFVILALIVGGVSLFVSKGLHQFTQRHEEPVTATATICDTTSDYPNGCIRNFTKATVVGAGGRVVSKDFSLLYGPGTIRDRSISIPYLVERGPKVGEDIANRPIIVCLAQDSLKRLVASTAFPLPPKGASGVIQAEAPRPANDVWCRVL